MSTPGHIIVAFVARCGRLRLFANKHTSGDDVHRTYRSPKRKIWLTYCGVVKPEVHGGSGAGYNRGCRCEPCKAAFRSRMYRRQQERFARTAEFGLPASVKHGVSAYTNWGCRCVICKEAQAYKNKKRYVDRQVV